MTRKESWLRKNVSGFMYHIELAAYKRYMLAVTAWNKWGQSQLEISKTLIISTNFTDGINRRTKTTMKSLHKSKISSSVTRNKNIFEKICLLCDMKDQSQQLGTEPYIKTVTEYNIQDLIYSIALKLPYFSCCVTKQLNLIKIAHY